MVEPIEIGRFRSINFGREGPHRPQAHRNWARHGPTGMPGLPTLSSLTTRQRRENPRTHQQGLQGFNHMLGLEQQAGQERSGFLFPLFAGNRGDVCPFRYQTLLKAAAFCPAALCCLHAPTCIIATHTASSPHVVWWNKSVASTHMLLRPVVLLLAATVVQTTAFLLPTITPLRPIVLVVCACLVPPALGRLRATGDDAPPSSLRAMGLWGIVVA